MGDRKGHILAKALGITVIGTLGVILLAYKLDRISRVKNELDNFEELTVFGSVIDSTRS